MEVFMANVPVGLPDRGLHRQMVPVMDALQLRDYVFYKSRNQKWAKLTFLRIEDGNKFLAHHAEVELKPLKPGFGSSTGRNGKPRTESRLRVLDRPVYCRPSQDKPDPYAIRSLQLSAQQRAEEEPRNEEHSVIFEVLAMACGHYSFIKDALTFVPDVRWNTAGTAKFSRKFLTVKLKDLRIEIPFDSVFEMICHSGHLTLTLTQVPTFSTSDSLDSLLTSLNFRGPGFHQPPKRTRVVSIDNQHGKVIGSSLVYWFDVSPSKFEKNLRLLEKKDRLATTRFHLLYMPSVDDLEEQMRALMADFYRCTERNLLPFGVLFLLQGLVHNGYLHPRTVRQLAKTLVKGHKQPCVTTDPSHVQSSQSCSVSVEAVKKLYSQIPYPSPHCEPGNFDPHVIAELVQKNERDIQAGWSLTSPLYLPSNNLARVYRIAVTPTRMTLHGPEMEAMNRILRKFPHHHDFFIRLQFCEEDGEDMHFNQQMSQDHVYARFQEIMRHGIQVAGRLYKFLGFSHSSLRNHSIWMSAPFWHDGKLQTYQTIIGALGVFTGIRSPARCAARIGQAFSETPWAISLSGSEILLNFIPDVERGSRVFSDGVGTISQEAMEEVWYHLPQSKKAPTCAQIRCAGYKGMLSLDPRLEGRQVCFRPASMEKFPCEDKDDLEICDVGSKPIPLYLNRQTIKILEDMGVSDDWFFKLQGAEVERIRAITSSTSNTAAFLDIKSVGDHIRLPAFYRALETLNIDYRRDRFMCSVVEALVLHELRLLKYKAHIRVQRGMVLWGVMDETGFLEENEVFVTYDTNAGQYKHDVIDGPIIVTRSPALHCGDVRMVQHVTPPREHPLHELANCIVFSQKGERDLPSQLSGGDLDGDKYDVIWDWECIPKTNFEPADYPRVLPKEIDRPVEVGDMVNFFVTFMQTDYLGVVATRHMILADQKETGTTDIDCISLAAQHSMAVDFSKTGIAVNLKDLPKASLYRPDFLAPAPPTRIFNMGEINFDEADQAVDHDSADEVEGGAPKHRYYESPKILGKLYRNVDEKKVWNDNIKLKRVRGNSTIWDAYLAYALERCEKHGISWTRRSEEAKRIRAAYEDMILGAMNDFSEHAREPLSELEVFVGFTVHKSGIQRRRQRDRSKKLKEEMDRITSVVTAQIRNAALVVEPPKSGILQTGAVSGSASQSEPTTNESGLASVELALACLCVGCLKEEELYYHADNRLKSFKLVSAAILQREMKATLETEPSSDAHGKRGGRPKARGGGFVGVRGL